MRATVLAGMPGILGCAPLNEVKIREDGRAMQAMQLSHCCPLSATYSLSKHHVSSHGSCLNKIPCDSASVIHPVSLYHLTYPETSTLGYSKID